MWAPPRIFGARVRAALRRGALVGLAVLLLGTACRREPAPAPAPAPAAEPAPAAPAAGSSGSGGSDGIGDARIGPEHLRYWTM